jgi:hypothetical protein
MATATWHPEFVQSVFEALTCLADYASACNALLLENNILQGGCLVCSLEYTTTAFAKPLIISSFIYSSHTKT